MANKYKLARQLNVGDKVYLRDGKAVVRDTTQIVSKGLPSKSGHITVLKLENLEVSNDNKVIELPVFAEDKFELVPKKVRKSWWSRLKDFFKRK